MWSAPTRCARRSRRRRGGCSRARRSTLRADVGPSSVSRASTAQAPRLRCSTPASTSHTRSCAAACCPASTCSIRVAMRAPGRTRPHPDGRSAMAPRSRACLSAHVAPRVSTALLPGRRCCRSALPVGSLTRTAAWPSMGAPTSCSPVSSSPSTRVRTATRTTRRAWHSSASGSRLQPSPTARSPGPSQAQLPSTRSSWRPPATTARPARPSAASTARAAHRQRSRSAPPIHAGAARLPTCSSAPGCA